MRFEDDVILVALGANLPSHAGPPRQTLRAALMMLERHGVRPIAISDYHQTAPVPPSGQPDFINAVAAMETDLDVAKTVATLHGVERALGRMRRQRWEARVIDLDLLAFGRTVVPEDWPGADAGSEAGEEARSLPLVVPHLRLHERPFVLAPLCDILPDWVHPVLGRSASDLVRKITLGAGRG